jgi:hypothetical protein
MRVGIEFWYTELHQIEYGCSRCGATRVVFADHDSRTRPRSEYTKLLDDGDCARGFRGGHVDCPAGCTHPPPILLIIRLIQSVFTGTSATGRGILIRDVGGGRLYGQRDHGIDDVREEMAIMYYPHSG